MNPELAPAISVPSYNTLPSTSVNFDNTAAFAKVLLSILLFRYVKLPSNSLCVKGFPFVLEKDDDVRKIVNKNLQI